MNSEDFGRDAENPGAGLDFGRSTAGEVQACLLVVADVAVGRADEFHLVTQFRPPRHSAADVQIAVVRMHAEGNYAELADGVPTLDDAASANRAIETRIRQANPGMATSSSFS